MSNRKQSNNKKNRKGVRGRGAYYPGGRVLGGQGGFFDDVSSFLSPLVKIGKGIGTVAGVASKLLGQGAYNPKKNTILASPVPDVHSSQDSGIRYRHKEYLGDITGSVNWEIVRFPVNPGLPGTFPWLSGVAGAFQKYRIDGLVFFIKSTTSAAIASSTNLSMGTIMGAFQYNAYDTAPTSKTDFLTLSGSVTGRPSDDHIYPLECDRSKNLFGNLLIRTAGVGDDLQKYDHATFNLATVGFQAEYPLGELWVSYDVVLQAPKTETSLPWYSTWALVASDYQNPLGGGYLNLASIKSKAKNESNTLKLGREVMSNLECFTLPAGSSGLYRISWAMFPNMVVDELPTIDFMAMDGLVFQGNMTMPDPMFSVQKRSDDASMTYSISGYWDVVINLKDETKPGLFTILITGPSGKIDGMQEYGYWSMQRLPDDMFVRGSAPGVVSQAKKLGKVAALLEAKPLSAGARAALEGHKAPQPMYWAEERKTSSSADPLRPLSLAPRRA